MKYKSIVYLIASFIISVGVIGIYQFDNLRIKNINTVDVQYVDKDNEKYLTNIDNIVSGDKYIEIDGWALEKGTINEYFNWVTGPDESVYNNNQVVLQDEDGNIYAINTVSEERLDVNELINDKINYRKCGFKALVKRNKLKENCKYKVGIIITTLEDEKILVMSEEEIVR